MKIELNDWQDVRDFAAMLSPELLKEWNPALKRTANQQHFADLGEMAAALADRAVPEPTGLPQDIASPQLVTHDDDAACVAGDSDELPARDADGAPYSADWHSAPQKLTDKGVWRAKRGRDATAYSAWLLEQAVEVAEATIAADADEPIATETHSLPQAEGDEPDAAPQEAGNEPSTASAKPTSSVDLEALLLDSQEAAGDASDSLSDLLASCRDFTSTHGHGAFNALKGAVAPRGDAGASLQEFTPGERRLMQACIANYPKKEA